MHRTLYVFLSLLVVVGSAVPSQAEFIPCTGKNPGDACDDDIFCNGIDTCGWVDGSWGCLFHSGPPCVGNDECENQCNEAADNCFLPEGTPCDDGLFCNGTDSCDGNGQCSVNTGDPCGAGGQCANACNEIANNCFLAQGTPCDDGLFCNGSDFCDGSGECSVNTGDPCAGQGECANTCDEAENTCSLPEGTPCDDGLFCNGTDSCDGNGQCSVNTGDPCAGQGECANTCNEFDDTCLLPKGTPCTDDGEICTDDQCDGNGVCARVPNSETCDDGLFCNGTDQCSGGECILHTGDPCPQGNECGPACDEQSDGCATPLGTRCSADDDPCTNDICLNGTCTHQKIVGCQVCQDDADCDDRNPCTTDICGAAGCTHDAVPGCGSCTDETDCSDGNLCTIDTCNNEMCGHTPIPGCTFCTVDADCDDEDPCTDDVCGDDGCENRLVTDCIACTVDADCNDADTCTVDRCGSASRCLYANRVCFGAVTCPFIGGLTLEACAGEIVPRAIRNLVNRAGCKAERAEERARNGRRLVEKKLKIAERSLKRATKKLKRLPRKRLSEACAGALSADLADRTSRLTALLDKANGGNQLAACTAAMTTPEASQEQVPALSLCGKR